MFSLVKTALAQSGRLPGRIVAQCDPTPGVDSPMYDAQGNLIEACTFDHIIQTGVNFVDALVALAILATILFVIVGAFRLVISAGNPEAIKAARQNVASALTGLIIVLVAWVVINTAITVFTDCSGQWYVFESFNCVK